jgi:hypothetical protein
MCLFLPIPENETTMEWTSPIRAGSPGEVPGWDLGAVKAGLGPVLPVPLKTPLKGKPPPLYG